MASGESRSSQFGSRSGFIFDRVGKLSSPLQLIHKGTNPLTIPAGDFFADF